MRSLLVFALLLFAVPAAAAPQTATQECMGQAELLDFARTETQKLHAKYEADGAGKELLDVIDSMGLQYIQVLQGQYSGCIKYYSCPESERVMNSGSTPPEITASFVSLLEFIFKTCGR